MYAQMYAQQYIVGETGASCRHGQVTEAVYQNIAHV